MPTCMPITTIGFNDDNELNLPDSPDCPLPKYVWLQNECYTTLDGEAQLFDIVIPKSNKKRPLVIFIHGGGFFQHDKSKGFKDQLKSTIACLLNAGIAYASIDYRLLQAPEDEQHGIKKCLFDCVSALQYIRFHADAYKIKNSHIAFLGESAGAGAALWIAFSKNMKSPDPLALPQFRQSTKVKGVVALETQSSYDMRKWVNEIFVDIPIGYTCLRDTITVPKLRAYYNIDPGILLDTDLQIKNAIAGYMTGNNDYLGNPGLKLDMISLMNKKCPPFWIESNGQSENFPPPGLGGTICVPDNSAQLNHHPYHARALYNRAESLLLSASPTDTLNVIADIPEISIDNLADEGYAGKKPVHFLIDILTI